MNEKAINREETKAKARAFQSEYVKVAIEEMRAREEKNRKSGKES
jgi:hypothetical protein